MKKLIAVSFVLAAGVMASVAFANNNKTEESTKIPPCRATYITCPNGTMTFKCNRKSSIVHPTCTEAETTGCNLIVPCPIR